MLKICEQKGVGDRYTLDQFYTLATLFVDPVPQVREKILLKLHKVSPQFPYPHSTQMETKKAEFRFVVFET